MFRMKGWYPAYKKMTNEELLQEHRRLKRARSFIFEKDEKISAIERLLSPKADLAELVRQRPGGIIRMV